MVHSSFDALPRKALQHVNKIYYRIKYALTNFHTKLSSLEVRFSARSAPVDLKFPLRAMQKKITNQEIHKISKKKNLKLL